MNHTNMTIKTLLTLMLTFVAMTVWAAEPVVVPAAVPEETIATMFALLTQRPGGSPEQAVLRRAENMDRVLAMGREAERTFPGAANLSQVYRIMLQAADFLVNARPGEASRTRLSELVDRILASDANVETKVTADFARTMHRAQTGGKPADDAARQIEAFAERHKNTAGAGQAYALAASLADMLKLADLRARFVKVLKANFLDDPAVLNYLRAMREYTDVGRPFAAKLTRLDGSTLTLPDDLKGKVVVIDFWATWCGPCRDDVPNMKTFYGMYKDKGVEIVGISVDATKEDVEKFVKRNGMTWIQTFDGREGPTAARFGVKGFPTLFVVKKDGTILSIDAHATLRDTVEKALQE